MGEATLEPSYEAAFRLCCASSHPSAACRLPSPRSLALTRRRTPSYGRSGSLNGSREHDPVLAGERRRAENRIGDRGGSIAKFEAIAQERLSRGDQRVPNLWRLRCGPCNLPHVKSCRCVAIADRRYSP